MDFLGRDCSTRSDGGGGEREREVVHVRACAYMQVRVLEASPGVDAVIAKGVGKPLPVQLQQLLNSHLGSAALS